MKKICRVCKLEKDLEDFCLNKRRLSGRDYLCKACKNEELKKIYAKRRERNKIDIPKTKVCPGCKQELSSDNFGRNASNKDGLQSRCRPCCGICVKKNREKYRSREQVDIPDFKTCSKCGEIKGGNDFNKNSREQDGLDDWCKKCSGRKLSKWVKENKDSGKRYVLRREYGVTLDWFNKTLSEQGGVCAICGKENNRKGYLLAIDHCHEDGRVRGLLCFFCNLGIGSFKDDCSILEKAKQYLSDTSAFILKDALNRTGFVAIPKKRSCSFKTQAKITKEQIQWLRSKQDNKCKICGFEFEDGSGMGAPRLDHNHETGAVRGLLCHNCNCGLGRFFDSIDLINKTIDYLTKYRLKAA